MFYITESENNKKDSDNSTKYRISKSEFRNGNAHVGGALYLNNIQYMQISNSTFDNFTVTNTSIDSIKHLGGSGGAIYYTCDSSYLDC